MSSSQQHPPSITAENASYCYLDVDVNHHRSHLALMAAFVHATDTRYGFSSPDLRALGGSEWSRVGQALATDFEWKDKALDEAAKAGSTNVASVVVKAPTTCSGTRIVLQLDWETAPLACENFATLCSNGGGDRSFEHQPAGSNNKTKLSTPPPAPIGESGKPLTYRGSVIHRVVPDFVIQGGDFVFGNGSGGECVFDKKKTFKDERAGLLKKHNQRGLLSMGNSGKNSNTSQFFITLGQTLPQCDGKHVIFGKVVSGHDIVDAIEALYTNNKEGGTDASSSTSTTSLVITDCGIWTPLQTPAAGYWYDQPDPESYNGSTPLFVVRPRVTIVAPTQTVVQKFQHVLSGTTAVVATLVTHQDESNDDDDDGASSLSSSIGRRLQTLLQDFGTDVIVVAPASKAMVLQELTTLPDSWTQHQPTITLDQVLLEAKPVEALDIVRRQSWFTHKNTNPAAWSHMDGVVP